MLERRSVVKSVGSCFGIFGSFMLAGAGESHAQQIGPSTCMAVTGETVPCANTGGDDGSTVLVLQGLGDLLGFNGEKSIRKKVGKMLADGDCQGATRYALEKGRMELANQVTQMSRSAAASAPASIDPKNLQGELRRVAASARTPMSLDEGITISKVDAVGDQLLLTALVDAKGATITDAFRKAVTDEVCAYKSSPPLLRAGASIRIAYFERSGREIGSVMTTRRECGL